MDMPKISIVVPVYKVENEIDRCVSSLLKQTFSDIEIILVDDGSPDKCPQICDEYASQDARVKVIHKENGGLSDARNAGLREAIGEYVLFVDSDDYIDERTCEKFYANIATNVDVIVGDGYRIESKGKFLMNHVDIPSQSAISGSDFLKAQLRCNKMNMAACLNLYNRKFLIDNDLFFKKGILHEDEQWTPRVFLNAKTVTVLGFPFYYYVIREGSITKRKDKTRNGIDLIATCYELEDIYENIDDTELKNLLNDYLAKLFLHAISLGDLYGKRYNGLYNKSFLCGKALGRKTKMKSCLFVINKTAYRYANRLYKRLGNNG